MQHGSGQLEYEFVQMFSSSDSQMIKHTSISVLNNVHDQVSLYTLQILTSHIWRAEK